MNMDDDDDDESMHLKRSTSMPVKPKHLQKKILERSKEMEIVYDTNDDDPESPIIQRNFNKDDYNFKEPQQQQQQQQQMNLVTHSQSLNNLAHNWSGSTNELNCDLEQNDNDNSDCGLRRDQYRVIEKNGHENVLFRRIPEKSWRYFRDLVTTLIELDWKYMLTMFLGSYFLSWFLFALLCYLFAYIHGDLETSTIKQSNIIRKEPCIVGVKDFTSMLIYSVETQTTIGFGEKYPSEECTETMILFIMQIIFSIAIEGAMVSVIYLKTARPAKQITKLKFSEKAVICYRDGKLCLVFRVCDLRKQQTIESKIRVYLVVDRITQEGEVIKTHTELKLVGNGEQIIEWPELVCHIIDKSSPLREFAKSAKILNSSLIELYVSIVGTSSSSAQITEARTSYIPREIFWGQSFINIISYDGNTERYMIDYSNFNSTISVDMETVTEE